MNQKNKQRKTKVINIGSSLIFILMLIWIIGWNHFRQTAYQSSVSTAMTQKSALTAPSVKNSSTPSTQNTPSVAISDFPPAKQSDWNLVLVNRTHPKSEFNPTLRTVADIQVDQRIAEQTAQFLAAAQAISPAEHLISGYRSVTYQEQLYQKYIQAEMSGHGTVNAGGVTISHEQAVVNVQTYSQPPENSEHNTGLAIDLSDVDSLNGSTIASKIAAIAPNYGFVLRFLEGKKAITGVGYEDWHFRYVGVENAKYMVAHHLTLEEYLRLLPD